VAKEQFGQPDPQVEWAKTTADDVEGYEFIGTDAGNPVDGWTDPPEGHAQPDINRDDERRRAG
jgi:hypothetical protein